ncbi:hypothetical protein lerEdw1_001995 [Lerista edwardsae]|nr:hypothetical protein lerEdw1_001995 [Lerista edwardsae]
MLALGTRRERQLPPLSDRTRCPASPAPCAWRCSRAPCGRPAVTCESGGRGCEIGLGAAGRRFPGQLLHTVHSGMSEAEKASLWGLPQYSVSRQQRCGLGKAD